MDPASPRPARPLDPKAVTAADDALYDAHKGDSRPNALFDAAGNRLPLSATDPSQECLRQEWVKLYGDNGGKLVTPKPKTGKPPSSPVVTCPLPKAKLKVNVLYEPVTAPVNQAEVTIKGPVTKTLTTDATGSVQFTDLPAGTYDITAVYTGKNKLVDLAKSHNGGKEWAGDTARSAPVVQTFPAGSNKCNLFVYEMLTGAGYSVPTKPHEQKLMGVTVRTVQIPPNAGDWASASELTGTATVVATPEPGDVIAWSHAYADATGHVGIVSYPKASAPASKTLADGDDETVDVTMRRKTISAHWDQVGDDSKTFWHYYDEGNTTETGNIIFRRMK